MKISRYHPKFLAANTSERLRAIAEAYEESRLALNSGIGGNRDFAFAARVAAIGLKKTRHAVLRVRCFVHERITLSLFEDSQGIGKLATKYIKAKRRQPAKRNLVIRRETQRWFPFGTGWKKTPLKTRFTTKAKNDLRDAAEVIERTPDGIGFFLTLTIPTGEAEDFERLSACAGYLVNRFNRRLREIALSSMYAYCWELQGRGTPHLHYVFRVKSGTDRRALYSSVRQIWTEVLSDAGKRMGCDFLSGRDASGNLIRSRFARVNFKQIQKGLGRYLSKYVSKSRSKAGKETLWHPGRWTGISHHARVSMQLARRQCDTDSSDFKLLARCFSQLLSSASEAGLQIFVPHEVKGYQCAFASIQPRDGTGKRVFRQIVEWLGAGGASELKLLGC